MIAKALKWSRRAGVALFCDRAWRNKACRPTWIGSLSGGAYVDLSSLGPKSFVYSFGIATEISFDRDIIGRTGCSVYGFDPDPRSEAWLNEPVRNVPEQFQFYRLALDATSGQRTFYLTDIEKMTGGFSGGKSSRAIEVDCLSLADIMKRFSHTWIDYLKLDVESAEYNIIESWLTEYDELPVGQLWIEFHPGGNSAKEAKGMSLVKSLSKIGMIPGYRNYFRAPNNYLLINRRLMGKRLES